MTYVIPIDSHIFLQYLICLSKISSRHESTEEERKVKVWLSWVA